jgi:hypothetical protein
MANELACARSPRVGCGSAQGGYSGVVTDLTPPPVVPDPDVPERPVPDDPPEPFLPDPDLPEQPVDPPPSPLPPDPPDQPVNPQARPRRAPSSATVLRCARARRNQTRRGVGGHGAVSVRRPTYARRSRGDRRVLRASTRATVFASTWSDGHRLNGHAPDGERGPASPRLGGAPRPARPLKPERLSADPLIGVVHRPGLNDLVRVLIPGVTGKARRREPMIAVGISIRARAALAHVCPNGSWPIARLEGASPPAEGRGPRITTRSKRVADGSLASQRSRGRHARLHFAAVRSSRRPEPW